MQVGAGYGEEEMCVCYVCFCAHTWLSWQPSEERSRSSDIPAAGPTPCSRPPNQWEQRGEGVQQLQNSFRSRRSGRMCVGRGGLMLRLILHALAVVNWRTSLRVDICLYRKPREKTEQQVEGFTPPPLSFYGFDNMTDKCAYVSAHGCAGLP